MDGDDAKCHSPPQPFYTCPRVVLPHGRGSKGASLDSPRGTTDMARCDDNRSRGTVVHAWLGGVLPTSSVVPGCVSTKGPFRGRDTVDQGYPDG